MRITTILACAFSLLVISINIYLVYDTVTSSLNSSDWLPITAVIIVGILYMLFCAYLILHLAVNLGFFSSNQVINRYVRSPSETSSSTKKLRVL
uniref:Uncharacterized protein n=1 Tax=Timema shepardi TaxID=629360 RepID=A0A7R9AR80_TIMSH|nr:unnamed protein product [Timema shepardi]